MFFDLSQPLLKLPPFRMKVIPGKVAVGFAFGFVLAPGIAGWSGVVFSAQSDHPGRPLTSITGVGTSTKAPPTPAKGRDVRKEGYLGLRLRETPDGVVVDKILPGAVAWSRERSASIRPGDLIVSINGQTLSARGYVALVRSLAPGNSVRVAYCRKVGNEIHTTSIVLEDRAKWSGTIGDGLAAGRVILPPATGEAEALLLTSADALSLRGGLNQLLAALAAKQETLLAPDTPSAVVMALRWPLSLDREEAEFAAEVRQLAKPLPLSATILAIHRLLLGALDLPDMRAQPTVKQLLAAARLKYRPLATKLLANLRDRLAFPEADLPSYLRLLRESRQIATTAVALLPDVAHRAEELERFAHQVMASPRPIPPDLKARVRAAVEGPILGAMRVDGQLWVVGGNGPDHYNMDRLGAAFDAGGKDSYTFSQPANTPYRIIIDASGDDTYQSTDDLAGPAAGAFSVDVVDDRGGNDHYVSAGEGSIAAAVCGVALLIDEAGDDTYLNETPAAGWSEGAAVYGAGVLIDRGGNDRYRAQVFAQGIGGPGGLGLLVDASGDDEYIANGPEFPSVYGTPAVFAGFSQGFGVGVRDYSPGGVGVLYDLSGNDRYIVGEFGQGTGYYQGLGILHDATGDDVYVGSRYAQGSAAHQAAGILVDGAGDDAYIGLGPAAQGAAWDQSVAMLMDRSGDDAYRGGTLAQGAAAQEAVGVLLDLAGRDRHTCTESCLGESGDNAYHYQTDRVFNFSALVDRGCSVDAYPAPRTNGELVRSGSVNRAQPAQSHCCGLFLDDQRREPLSQPAR